MRGKALALECVESLRLEYPPAAFCPREHHAQTQPAHQDEVPALQGHRLQKVLDPALVSAPEQVLELDLQTLHVVAVTEQEGVGL